MAPILKLGAFVLLVLAATWWPQGPSDTDKVAETAYSVQMHLHGSFSEGVGSIASQTHEAASVGVDALWWTDHDWRIARYRHVSRFDFEALVEPAFTGESWTPSLQYEQDEVKLVLLDSPDEDGYAPPSLGSFSLADYQIVADGSAFEGMASLLVRGRSSAPDFDPLYVSLVADRNRTNRSLAADVSLLLAIRPFEVSEDARISVLVMLSDHPANPSVPIHSRYWIQYVLDNETSEPTLEGSTFRVPVPFSTGWWNAFRFDVTRDAEMGFPFIEAEDNSLVQVFFGVETRNNALAAAFFDDLRILQEESGDSMLARQWDMLARKEVENPGVRQLQGVEISYFLPHLNEFGLEPVVHDYDELEALSGLATGGWISDVDAYMEFVAHYMVDDAHQRGALVSYNHMFGFLAESTAQTKEEMLQVLVDNQLYGADILEIGYRDRGEHELGDYLWIWDQLALQGLYPIGTGVSDSHGGPEGHWTTNENNFVSWIYARSPTSVHLLHGLASGRVFFGDIALFDGLVDVHTSDGFGMGTIVVTDEAQANVTFRIDGLDPADEVRIVELGVPVLVQLAGNESFLYNADFALPPDGGTFLRLEVYASDETAKVFSNPLHLVREAPTGGIRPERAALALGDVRSRTFVNFVLSGASYTPSGPGGSLQIDGDGNGGKIVLDYSATSPPTAVTFEGGLTGTWFTTEGQMLVLTDLQGLGGVRIDN
ncbi:MAG: hypothetical protein O7B99_06570 [Planctomycetota bacterium]|nr:hypothetical protein [Planctomycetota bacterium]